MPIKFRCRYCKQNLGISRTKAGAVVDCPTCGRSVRVPQKNGVAERVPEPKLDIRDPHVARAMNELAALGMDVRPRNQTPSSLPEERAIRETREAQSRPRKTPESAASSDEVAIKPAVVSQELVVEVEPRTAPEPVPIEPVPLAEPVSPTDGEDEKTFDAHQLDAELQHLAEDFRPAEKSLQGVSAAAETSQRWSRLWFRYRNPLLGFTLLLVGIALGVIAARQWNGSVAENNLQPDDTPASSDVSRNANSTEQPANADREMVSNLVVNGRIEGAQGESLVLILPRGKSAVLPIPASLFAPPASSPEFRTAAAVVKATGGAAVLVPEPGTFRVVLPQPGTFDVVVLSPAEEGSAVDPSSTTAQTLERFVAGADEWLRSRRGFSQPLTVSGDDSTELTLKPRW